MNAALIKLYKWNWIPYFVIAVTVGWMAYDAFMPVVWMRGTVMEKSMDHIVLRMQGYKLRECKYVGIQAYSINAEGIRSTDTLIRRIDSDARGVSRPVGYYDLGLWDVRPTTGAKGVVVYAQHACDETDLRSSKMAEVQL